MKTIKYDEIDIEGWSAILYLDGKFVDEVYLLDVVKQWLKESDLHKRVKI